MSTKSLVKVGVLENWYGIDKLLFGDKDPKDILKEEKYSEYLSTKSALLSNLFEIYLQIKYSPTRKFVDISEMQEYASHKSFIAKKNAKDLIESDEISDLIKKEIAGISKIEGLSESEVVEHVVSKNYKAVAIDCLTLSEALENGCSKCINNWDGKIKLDAHKVLRDKLVNLV